MRPLGGALAAAGALALFSPVLAAAPAGVDTATPVARPETEPPEPRLGFLASVGFGPGYLFASSGGRSDTRRFRGGSFSFQVLLGGHFSPTFSAGAAYLRDQIFGLHSTDSQKDGDEPNLDQVSFFTSSIGFFMDVRVLKRPELHVIPVIAYSQLYVDGRLSQVDNPTGPLFALTATTDFRVAQHAALGVGIRLSYAPFMITETPNVDTSVPTVIPALLVTARYD